MKSAYEPSAWPIRSDSGFIHLALYEERVKRHGEAQCPSPAARCGVERTSHETTVYKAYKGNHLFDLPCNAGVF